MKVADCKISNDVSVFPNLSVENGFVCCKKKKCCKKYKKKAVHCKKCPKL
jgi:hypothetical protein